MTGDDGFCVVLTTVADADEARRLAGGMVRKGLAACVQAIPMQSVYLWQGEIEEADEVLLLVKTRRARYHDVERFITAEHSYDVPEVVCLPVAAGLSAYLAWIHDATA